ncbi:DUF4233 domain-containing protein [Amycolatopsis cihanbeyliensis]|nr:DUF4233 domain-containing protein [Amycolatopsis cihanbeyliensis]
MRSFRGVMAGSLVIEAIVVGLALPVVGTLGDGIASGQAWTVGAIAVALILCCGFLRRPWVSWAVLALQVALIGFVVWLPAVAVIGVLFLAIWLWLFWLRRDVARRKAEGRLPSQQQG